MGGEGHRWFPVAQLPEERKRERVLGTVSSIWEGSKVRGLQDLRP